MEITHQIVLRHPGDEPEIVGYACDLEKAGDAAAGILAGLVFRAACPLPDETHDAFLYEGTIFVQNLGAVLGAHDDALVMLNHEDVEGIAEGMHYM